MRETIVSAVLLGAGSLVGLMLLLRSRRLIVGGFNLFERRRMRREGTPARARVLDAALCKLGGPHDDLSQDYRVVVEVRPPDAPPQRVQLSVRWRPFKWGAMVAGAEFPVLVSPSFPGRAMFDLPALRGERRRAEQQRAIDDEERQRALLDRQR